MKYLNFAWVNIILNGVWKLDHNKIFPGPVFFYLHNTVTFLPNTQYKRKNCIIVFLYRISHFTKYNNMQSK